MTIDQYLYIIEIADSGSFSQAARNLYLSQPNLSYIVKTIEKKLGTPIFIRTSDGVLPTKEGAELIEQLRFLKRECAMVDEMFAGEVIGSRLSFKVATLNLISTFPTFLSIASKYYTSRIDFSWNDYSSLSELLNHLGDVELALVGMVTPFVSKLKTDLYHKSIEYHPIAELPICAIVGTDSPLYGTTDSITTEELVKYTLLQYTDNSTDPQQSIIHALGVSNKAFGKVHVNSSEAFYKAIRETPLVGLDAVSPQKFKQCNDFKDIQLIRISDSNLHWQVAWIKKRRIPLSDIGAEFLELAKTLF